MGMIKIEKYIFYVFKDSFKNKMFQKDSKIWVQSSENQNQQLPSNIGFKKYFTHFFTGIFHEFKTI